MFVVTMCAYSNVEELAKFKSHSKLCFNTKQNSDFFCFSKWKWIGLRLCAFSVVHQHSSTLYTILLVFGTIESVRKTQFENKKNYKKKKN